VIILMALRKLEPEDYDLLDQRDEEQILAEIKGNIITEMFYSFTIEGRKVTGVSWVGTKEIARQYGNVNMDFIKCEETPDSYIAIVKATDTKRGTSLLGTAMQSKTMKIRGEDKPDRFAYTKAVSKAQRNAIRAIIPERYLLEMYELFTKGVNFKTLVPPKQTPRKQVKATQQAESKEWKLKNDKIDPEEEAMGLTLEANDLDPEVVTIMKYGKAIRVQPKEEFDQEKFDEYNHVIVDLLGGRYVKEWGYWEKPIK